MIDSMTSASARRRLLSVRGEPLLLSDWDRALFMHFEVDASALQAELPFTLDLREGKAYVSLVAFTMRRMRPRLGGKIAECSRGDPIDECGGHWLTNSFNASCAFGSASRRRACFSSPTRVASSPFSAAANSAASGIVSHNEYESLFAAAHAFSFGLGVSSSRKRKFGDCSIASTTTCAPLMKSVSPFIRAS